MTKEQFETRINALIADMVPKLREECGRLYRSGAEDVEAYGDDFILPKLIMSVVMEQEARQYANMPHQKNWKKRIANLRHF